MFWKSYVNLQLAISGSGVLPVPKAFASVGILPGVVICCIVALMNDSATTWLLVSAGRGDTMATTYSQVLREFRPWTRVAAELASATLLFGSFAACLAAGAETASRALARDVEPRATRAVAPVVQILVVLCVGSQTYASMRWTSALGCVFMVGLVAAVALACALQDELRRPRSNAWLLPEAITTLGYSFYLAPVALSLLSHLGDGDDSERLTAVRRASRATMVVTLCAYTVLGVTGSLWKGRDTPGDIATAFDDGSGVAVATAVYLLLSLTTMLNPLRDAAAGLLPGYGDTLAALLVVLAAIASTRESSLTLFSLTGATGVCVTCYVVPVAAYWAGDDPSKRARVWWPGLVLAGGITVSLLSVALTFTGEAER